MQIHPRVSRVYAPLPSDCFHIYSRFCQIATRAKNDISIIARIPGTTIGAGPFFQRTAILHVMTNAIRVLESGATTVFCQPWHSHTNIYYFIFFMQTVRNARSSRMRMAICPDRRFEPAVYLTPSC